MKKLVLIDSNALVHRAFHALPMLTAPDGTPTNAVYGFVSVMLKMMTDLKPDYIAATFDLAGPTFRHEEYEEYKAHRVKAPDELYAQIPVVKKLLASFGVPVYEQAGYEADDVLGSIAEMAKKTPDLQVVIMTGDLDTLQLVDGHKVVVFTLRKGVTDTILYDEAMVNERYGLAPEQVADWKGLKGDPSDNIPGVPGVGEKTATALIQEFGSIEKLYEAIEEGVVKKPLTEKLIAKLIEHKDMALFSKRLATIIRTVDVQFDLEKTDWHKYVDMAALEIQCRDLGFYSLMKRVNTALGTAIKATTAQSLDLDGTREPLADVARTVDTADALPDGTTVAVQLLSDERGIALTVDGQETVMSPEVVPDKTLTRYTTIRGHDLKPLIKKMTDVTVLNGRELFDTAIAAWLLNPDQREYTLDRVYYETASQALPSEQSQWPLAVWRLAPLLWDRMKSLDLLPVFTDIEMPLIPILARMEQTGILVNTETIRDLLESSSKQLAELEQKIYELAGMEFNINSPAQLGEVLFTKLVIKGKVRRTGGGAPSTAAPELEKLREEHPIIPLILEYRELNKLKSTYIEPFPSLIAADGRLHTTYNQGGAGTGRMSSSNPNLQNIPTRTELGQQFRAAFIAAPGTQLVSFDYSQLELRLIAHAAHDETMTAAFRAGEDIHTRTASEIFGVVPADVTKDMRRQAKVLNFGIIYGMGVLGFARAAGVSRDTAKKFIEEYFTRFHGVARYMEHTKDEAFKQGYVTTLFGRRRPVPDIKSRIPQLVAQAERMAINHPLQGTGADIVKLAMIGVDRFIQEHHLTDIVRPLLQVHDELVIEIASDRVAELAPQIKSIMENVHALDVPLIVDVKAGSDWAHMQKIEDTDHA
jgi:DNA polymerase-1